MRRYLLDTGIAGDFINRRKDVFEQAQVALRRGDSVGISVSVLGELWAGVELSDTRALNEKRLRRVIPSLCIWPFTEQASCEYGRIFALLQRKGRLIQQVDIQTAAIALALGNCTVVTKDKHFSYIPGLKVENWAKG